MCGRFYLDPDMAEFYGLFPGLDLPDDVTALFGRECFPTDTIPILLPNDASGYEAIPSRWGFERPWSKRPLFNAKAEGIAEKSTWAKAFREARCLVPASEFYEWRGEKGSKEKITFRLAGGGLFCFAGLWESTDAGVYSTIITTEPNSVVKEVHNRMPVILPQESWQPWLEGENAEGVLRPFPSEEMEASGEPKREQGDLFG